MKECWAKNHDLREEKWHFLNPSVIKGIGTDIGYKGGGGSGRPLPQVSHDSLDLEA